MVKYRIFETDQFIEDLSQDFEGRGDKIRKKLSEFVYPQLRENPYFGKNIKKLKNYKPDTWRYKIGNYRFFYELDEKDHIIYMTTADASKDSF
ncbi:MAG: type II toxin-antitoxin system RelE/ParE family toxin [Thermodesulfovibrionales bacterium]|nr:type II toxin-antitoxin system RelE/ParE family toxin [Thermodesulfovibrionales bacterium]MDP3112474.1 type II toxin-antitoxin system RelE/ParE family toxin [Thermodesulfovibrionales bacterium]